MMTYGLVKKKNISKKRPKQLGQASERETNTSKNNVNNYKKHPSMQIMMMASV